MPALKQNFIARNRIVSGLSDVLLITEAGVTSGSLHTARFALDQGKTIMAVPGNITSPGSEGSNNLIKNGATPVTGVSDIYYALGLNPDLQKEFRVFRGQPEEEKVLKLIRQGTADNDSLAVGAKIDGQSLASILTIL